MASPPVTLEAAMITKGRPAPDPVAVRRQLVVAVGLLKADRSESSKRQTRIHIDVLLERYLLALTS